MNVIEIEHLTYSYPGAGEPTLKDVTVQIQKGDFLAIVGNNGCGKSTFCKTLNGLIPQFISGAFSGSVRACGLDTREADVGALAQKVGYVYQDFENQIIRPTVLDDASYACLNYAMTDYRERGLRALEQCGLTGKEQDYIWQLSGGQTHLLALAGAVSLQPEVLILDEPIAQLDPMHADRIYGVLKDLNEKYGKTIIVIEHHTEYIADYCKHVMLMKDGGVQWTLPTDEALRRVEELQACNIFPPQVTIAAHRMQQMGHLDWNTPLPTTVEEGRAVFVPAFTQQARIQESPKPAGEPVVEFEHVSLAYRSVKGEPHTVYDDLSLTVRKGDKVALIGSNGAGKSTMMKMMVGLLKPGTGDVRLCGRSIRSLKPEALSRQISMVYQNPEDMFIKDSIGGDIAYAMEVRGMDFLRNQVLKNAYGNNDTVIAAMDPRILLVWYLFFGLVPWFVDDLPFLLGCFLLVAVTTRLARVAGLVLVLFAVGVFSQTGYLLLVTLFFGGDASAVMPLLVLTLKVATVSLASVTIFSGLDPDNLANGLMWFGCPERLSFSISYAYRMLPMLMEEFQNVLLSYRLRGNPPAHETLGGKIKYLIYQIQIVIHAFYPLMLNTAKRSRTTVEVLEIKGYRYAAADQAVKKIKLSYLKVSNNDLLFLSISFLWVAVTVLISTWL